MADRCERNVTLVLSPLSALRLPHNGWRHILLATPGAAAPTVYQALTALSGGVPDSVSLETSPHLM